MVQTAGGARRPLRSFALVVTLVVGASACGSAASESPDPLAPMTASDGWELGEVPDVHGSGEGIEPALPFGTPTDDVLNTLGVLLGPSTDDTGFVGATELCLDPAADSHRMRRVSWGDLDVVFDEEGGLVSWILTDRGHHNGAAFTIEGLGVGSAVDRVTDEYVAEAHNGSVTMLRAGDGCRQPIV